MKKTYEVFVTEQVRLSVLVEAESAKEAIENWEDSNRTTEVDSKLLSVEVGNAVQG